MSYMCFWCNRFHGLLAYSNSPLRNGQEATAYLLKKAGGAGPAGVGGRPPAAEGNEAGPPVPPSAATPPPPASPSVPEAPPTENKSPFEVVPGTSTGPGTIPPPAPPQNPEGPPAAAATGPVPPGSPPSPQADTLDAELAQRRVLVNAAQLQLIDSAIVHPDTRIIELADDCTADKLDDAQTDRLIAWVSGGGVLWTNNDVLTLFRIRHSSLTGGGGTMMCVASTSPEAAPILGNCKKVVLKEIEGKACSLGYRGVIPLLVLERDFSPKLKAGTAYWSLVPYGKGWVSDPKSVNLNEFDGLQFCATSANSASERGSSKRRRQKRHRSLQSRPRRSRSRGVRLR